jgi:hypothetical protein
MAGEAEFASTPGGRWPIEFVMDCHMGSPETQPRAAARRALSVILMIVASLGTSVVGPRAAGADEARPHLLVRTVQAASGGDAGRSFAASIDVQIVRGTVPRALVRAGEPAPQVTVALAEVKQGVAVGPTVLMVRLEGKAGRIERGNLLATIIDAAGKPHRVGAVLTAGGEGPQIIEVPLHLADQAAPVDLSQIRLAFLPRGSSAATTASVAVLQPRS